MKNALKLFLLALMAVLSGCSEQYPEGTKYHSLVLCDKGVIATLNFAKNGEVLSAEAKGGLEFNANSKKLTWNSGKTEVIEFSDPANPVMKTANLPYLNGKGVYSVCDLRHKIVAPK